MKTWFDVYRNHRLVAVCDATALMRWFPRGIVDRSAATRWGYQPSEWYVIRRFA